MVEIDFEKISTKVKCIENSVPSSIGGLVVNLHPEFVIPKDQLHQDSSFPWLNDLSRMVGKALRNPKTKLPEPLLDQGINFIDGFTLLGGSKFIVDEWRLLKKAWSLTLSGHADLAQNVLRPHSADFGYDNDTTFDDWLFSFSSKLLVPAQWPIFANAGDFLKRASRAYRSELSRFIQFYRDKLREQHFERYFDLYSEYFKDFTEYGQVLVYVRNKDVLPTGYQASSKAFNRTKMFYGNAFEVLTMHYVVLACINNVASGRPFNQFSDMSLTKYMTLKKTLRAKPFMNVVELTPFANNLDSTLRNASHHAAMKLNKHSGIIHYRSGGTGAEKELSYAEYLIKCNEIMLITASLLMLELILAYQPSAEPKGACNATESNR